MEWKGKSRTSNQSESGFKFLRLRNPIKVTQNRANLVIKLFPQQWQLRYKHQLMVASTSCAQPVIPFKGSGWKWMGKGSSDRQCNNLVVVIRTLLFCLRQRPPPAIYLLQNSEKQPGTQKRRNKGTSSTAAEEAVDQEEEQPPLRPVASSSVVEEETKSKCKKNLIRKQVIIGSTPRNESTQSLSESEDKKTINTM